MECDLTEKTLANVQRLCFSENLCLGCPLDSELASTVDVRLDSR